MKILLLSLITLSLVGCNQNTTTGSADASNSSSGGGITITDGSGSSGDDGSGDNSDSTGDSGDTSSNDGGTTGSGGPVHEFNMFLAGHQSWVPGTYTNVLAQSTMPTIREAGILFRSDSRLRIRLQVNSQPFPIAGDEFCFGRQTGQASDANRYTQLRFTVSLRDIMCDTPDPNDQTNCLSDFYLGGIYQIIRSSPVNVGSFSDVIDVGARRNSTQYGTVVEVSDVRGDITCQANGTFCPSEQIIRRASCWDMRMQVSTDFTQDFN